MAKIPIAVITDKPHECLGKRKQLLKQKGYVPSDNENEAISKMPDSQAERKTLKPVQENEQISELSRNLASLYNDFQDYKRKTEKRLSELEDL